MGTVASRDIDSGNEWATPEWVVANGRELLGADFDLDPAASETNAKAPTFYTEEQDGIQQEWFGHVWLNPPFSKPENVCKPDCRKKTCAKRGHHLDKPIRGAADFAQKAVEELQSGRVEAIAWHGPVASDTGWFAVLWPYVEKMVLFSGRIRYNGGKSGGTFPSTNMILRPVPVPCGEKQIQMVRNGPVGGPEQ